MRRRAVSRCMALPLYLAFSVLLCLALLSVTQLGQHARRQFYLQSVADNAAMSAGVLMARQLNFAALLNRALIGNQVALAQWVGLHSWFNMMLSLLNNSSTVLSFVPVLTGPMVTLKRALKGIKLGTERGLSAVVMLHVAIIQAISALQTVLQHTLIAEIPFSLNDVVAAHDETLEWDAFHGGGIVPFPTLWWRLTQVESTRDKEQSAFFKTLVLKSRDPFSKKRTYNWLDTYALKIRRAGGSDLATRWNGEWNWHAIDTVSAHWRKYWAFGSMKERLPLAWGASAQYVRVKRWASLYGESEWINPWATWLGWQSMARLKVKQPAFRFVRLQHKARLGADKIVIKVTDPESEQQAVAKAEVFFSRPNSLFPRSDSKHEKENLFNALWQTKLSPLSLIEQTVLGIQAYEKST
mgnify:FL=1